MILEGGSAVLRGEQQVPHQEPSGGGTLRIVASRQPGFKDTGQHLGALLLECRPIDRPVAVSKSSLRHSPGPYLPASLPW